MSSLGKLLVGIGLLSLFPVMPLTAQWTMPAGRIDSTLKFTTPFSFYVNQVKMPAGSYVLEHASDFNLNVMRIQSKNGLHTALFQITPAKSSLPEDDAQMIFRRYGNGLYFDRALDGSENAGVMLVPSKATRRAEETVAHHAQERSVVATRS